jgi:hypothetical protein
MIALFSVRFPSKQAASKLRTKGMEGFSESRASKKTRACSTSGARSARMHVRDNSTLVRWPVHSQTHFDRPCIESSDSTKLGTAVEGYKRGQEVVTCSVSRTVFATAVSEVTVMWCEVRIRSFFRCLKDGNHCIRNMNVSAYFQMLF